MAAGGRTARGGGRPTLAAVAEAAGVSLKTASRVLNDEPSVAEATRLKVRAAADTLGFRRNAVAADLARGGGSRLVGFVTGDIANPFYSDLAGGIERELRKHGLQLITTSSDEDADQERELIDALIERRVAALFIAPTAADHSYLHAELATGVPVVFLDRPPSGIEADTVVLDNRAGAAAAARHLLAQGHRRIALAGDLSRLWTFRERHEGFVGALHAAGIEDPERYVRDGLHDATTAREAVLELLALDEPPTAILTANNKITQGALRALRTGHGTRRDVALVGFDDFELADVLDVTVVGYEISAMGQAAARLAVDRIESPGGAPRLRVVPTVLVPRGSGEIAPRLAAVEVPAAR
ncbi:LacI family transcriptional regulator [Oerskovia turbata]|uniref:LacI family transcriptional regulator n=1 Tax=Oerskovia turbata TaxID=1713 RepID=A0A4Q1KKE1_9CELL|nr:LacI family DNA-binding transcriptional regulator [Oerskovia turbata]RXR25744.1 LacI family transcriptional regulator [Oerskovia turbata]RXR30187.1 LacI family transcriptional regulator [Oerskovia turbata]